MAAFLAICAVWALALPASSDERPTVQSVLPGRAADGSAGVPERIVVAMSDVPEPQVFTLTDPNRLVIDMAPFDWQAGEVDVTALPYALEFRHGAFRHDRSRIVIRLSRPVAVTSVETERRDAGEALVLSLAPTTQEGFAVTAGWPEGARWAPETRQVRRPKGDVVILIDPGHGGIDPGASSHGLVEKTIVLGFSRRLRRSIDQIPGLTAAMTREDDRFVPLRGRLEIARESGASALVSLHTDTLAAGKADGISFYTLSRRGIDSAADAFAERENRADVLAGADLAGQEDTLTRVLIELARRGTNQQSIVLADTLRETLETETDLLKTRPHRFGNFFVLKAPDIPSVLVELGFLNSAADRKRLSDPEWQERVARGMAQAIAKWVRSAPEGFLRRGE